MKHFAELYMHVMCYTYRLSGTYITIKTVGFFEFWTLELSRLPHFYRNNLHWLIGCNVCQLQR
jgi:hypothetical protein